jgi:hypothetical protein
MKVVILPEVTDYFLELADILYDRGYLGFEEVAVNYVRELFEEIRDRLPDMHRKVAPKYFDRYGKGMFYTVFKRNQNTSWLVFFNIYHSGGEVVYFVRYVSNNHLIAQYL